MASMKSLTLLILSSLACQALADIFPMEIDVIPAHENFHLMYQTEGDPFKSTDSKVSLVQVHPGKIPSLGDGIIYNIGELMLNAGLSHNDQELFLYSPESRLVFCHARPDRVALALALMEPLHEGIVAHQISLWSDLAELKDGLWIPHPDSKRLIFSIRSRSGAGAKVKSNNGTDCMAQITLGDSNEKIDIIISGDVPLDDSILSITSHFIGEPEQDIMVFQQPHKEHENKRHRLFIRIEPKPTEDQLRFDPAWRKDRAKKIAAELGLKNPKSE